LAINNWFHPRPALVVGASALILATATLAVCYLSGMACTAPEKRIHEPPVAVHLKRTATDELASLQAEMVREGNGASPSTPPNPVATVTRLVTITGKVLCDLTGEAVEADITLGDTSSSTDDAGRFLVEDVVPANSTLTVITKGYVSLDITVDPIWTWHELGELRLIPSSTVEVYVETEDGTPVQGAVVSIATVERPGTAGSRLGTGLGSTNEFGLLAAVLRTPETLLATSGNQSSPPVTAMDSTRRVILKLSDDADRVGLRDRDSKSPVGGVDLVFTRISSLPWVSFTATTSETGLIEAPLPFGRYRVRDPGNRLLFSITAGALPNPGVSGVPTRLDFAMLELSKSGQTLWVDAEPRGERVIVAVEEGSQQHLAPILGWLSSYETPPDVEDAQWMPLGSAPVVSDSGRLSLYHFTAAFLARHPYRLYVTSPGFRTGFISDPLNTVLPGKPPFTVALMRSPERCLFVINPDGSPYRRSVHVREGRQSQLTVTAIPSATGKVGPFAWHGSHLTVLAGREPWSPKLAHISVDELQQSDSIEVVVDASCVIEVDIPAGPRPRLIATRGTGSMFEGSERDGVLRFAALQPGSYEVGPRSALSSSELKLMQGMEAFPIHLESGQTVKVPWRSEWSLAGPISGRVVAPGMAGVDLFAIPKYGPTSLPLYGGRSVHAYPVSDDGTFEMLGLEMTPTHVMFARLDEQGQEVPLGTGSIAGDTTLRCTEVKVTIIGATSGANVCVRCVPVIGGRSVVSPVRCCGPVDSSVVLGWVSSETRVFSIIADGQSWSVELELDPGQSKSFVIDIGSLAPTGK